MNCGQTVGLLGSFKDQFEVGNQGLKVFPFSILPHHIHIHSHCPWVESCLFLFLTFYFVLGYSQLTMLW